MGTRDKVGHGHARSVYLPARPHHGLRRHAFAAPGTEAHGGSPGIPGHIILGITHVNAAPPHLRSGGHAGPYGLGVVRVAIGQFARHQSWCLGP